MKHSPSREVALAMVAKQLLLSKTCLVYLVQFEEQTKSSAQARQRTSELSSSVWRQERYCTGHQEQRESKLSTKFQRNKNFELCLGVTSRRRDTAVVRKQLTAHNSGSENEQAKYTPDFLNSKRHVCAVAIRSHREKQGKCVVSSGLSQRAWT